MSHINFYSMEYFNLSETEYIDLFDEHFPANIRKEI